MGNFMKKFLFVSKSVAEAFASDVADSKLEYVGDGCWAVLAPAAFEGHVRYFYDWAFIGYCD